MSESVRLTLVSHAMTDAMAAGRFPRDEPLNALGRRQVAAAADLRPTVGSADLRPTVGSADLRPTVGSVCAPELRARQTAELLGLPAETEPLLADLNCGLWRGRDLDGVEPAELVEWLTDPSLAPHGGESVVHLVERVRGWLGALGPRHGRLIAVTHPGVIRAAIVVALDAPPKSFWRIDIGPVSSTVMHLRGGAWTLRCTA